MVKKGVEREVADIIGKSERPLTTREIAKKLSVAWHTADRYCLKLQLKNKVSCFTIGKSTAWFRKK